KAALRSSSAFLGSKGYPRRTTSSSARRRTRSAPRTTGRGKKILSDLEDHFNSTILPLPPPKEWDEFRLCAALGKLPHELDALPEGTYQLWQAFLSIHEQSKQAGML